MSKRIFIFVITAIVAVVFSCSNANTPQKLDAFVDETELSCDGYDANDWQRSMVRFEELVNEYDSSGKQYTEGEKQMAARAIGRYHSLLIKNGVELTAAYLEELKAVLPSYLDGLMNGLDENSEEIEKSLKSIFNSEELEKVFSAFGEKMDEVFSGMDKE